MVLMAVVPMTIVKVTSSVLSVLYTPRSVDGRRGTSRFVGGIMMMAFGCVAPVVDNGNFNQPDGLEWLLAHCVCRRRGRSGSWVVDVVVAVVVLVEGSE